MTSREGAGSVLIVGAGIGGLTAALSLHAAGVGARVIDTARSLTPLGVGINLQPQAVRELTELGLGGALAELATPIAGAVHFDRHGNRIWAEPRGVAAGYRWPQYAVHRGELQMLLLRAVRDRLGPDAVTPGVAFEGFAGTGAAGRSGAGPSDAAGAATGTGSDHGAGQGRDAGQGRNSGQGRDAGQGQNAGRGEDAGVAVRVSDRVGGRTSTWTVRAVVGADGLHSAVRAALHPGEGAPLGNGIRMWRGTLVREPFLDGATMIVAGCNTWSKFVAYPISPVRDGLVTLNWVAEVRQPDDGTPADWSAVGRLDDVLPHFADWRYDWLDVPALIEGTGVILEYPMVDRDPLPWWGTGRVTLLGDAAHPMYPIGSNGGSQAILDARVLANRLATADDMVAGLAGYEAERRDTANAVLLANRGMGPERILRTVAERAPDGFVRVEDVLSAEELASIGDAYRKTSTAEARLLNERPSLSVPGRDENSGDEMLRVFR